MLRADLLDGMVRSGVRSCTVAPEAGSERLRQFIRKEMTEADILAGVDRLLGQGMRNLKLYTMIGLPTETDDDLQELIALVYKIWDLMKHYGRLRGALGTLTLSVNPFIPKPATPLHAMVSKDWSQVTPCCRMDGSVSILVARFQRGNDAQIVAERSSTLHPKISHRKSTS